MTGAQLAAVRHVVAAMLQEYYHFRASARFIRSAPDLSGP